VRVVVLGAGVIGVTTAWCLAAEGHEVRVLDHAGEVGAGASAANAGLLAIGDSTVWSAPRAPLDLGRSLLARRSGPLRLRRSAGLALLPWGTRFLAQCLPRRHRANVAAAHALSLYSVDELARLREHEKLEFGFERNGMLMLSGRAPALAELLAERRRLLAGEPLELLDRDALVKLDPGFAAAGPALAGAVYSPRSGHADCRAFTRALAERAAGAGVHFSLGRSLTALHREGAALVGCETEDGGIESADAYVLALGAASSKLAAGAGLRLAIAPASGYSVTVPLRAGGRVAAVGGVDEDERVAFSRIGDGLRLTSTAEFRGHRSGHRDADFAAIRRSGEKLFPGALEWAAARPGDGLRPVTPSGLPLIGQSAVANLFLNTGHGHLGWTQAMGSARLLCDLLAGRTPQISPIPYQP